MKILKNKILPISLIWLLTCAIVSFNNEPSKTEAANLDNQDYYSLLATAIDVSNTNTFEDNKNPQIFDSNSDLFTNLISARKDTDTYASSIEATSAYEFSQKYSKVFSTSVDANLDIDSVTTDISGKFATNSNLESWKQKIENYQYYYWYAPKYTVNIDWKNENTNNAFSSSFKRELNKVNSVISAKELLRTYGTHVYNTYVLGGKLEISKYFVQDASYELSEAEKSVAASLNVIVNTAIGEAKIKGSVNLSQYESNSTSNSHYYSRLNYHSYGGDINGAVTASDLFQYKTQFGTGTASGFLYEAWTKSFNNDGVALKIISAKNAIAIWDILDSTTYNSQIAYLKKAFDNMCYESYAEKCGELNIACDYIDSLSYESKGINVNISPYTSNIILPENTSVKINLNKSITNNTENMDYSLNLSSDDVANLVENTLNIKKDTIGRKFSIEFLINGLKAYTLNITIGKESYSGGYGTQQQPFLINNKHDLISMISDFSESNQLYYQLSSDIDLQGEKLDVGGSGTSSSFNGTFDGNKHIIKNCTIKANSFSNEYPYIGLFGKNDGTIKNLVLENIICLNDGLIRINNSNVSISAGILTGYNSGIISNCQVKDSAIRISTDINSYDNYVNVGGIVGHSDGYIEYSAFTNGNIYGVATKGNGNINIGGIAGILVGAKISESYINSSKINVYNNDKIIYSLGGIVGNMIPTNTEEASIIRPKVTMCLAYDIISNKFSNTFGYIAGVETNGEFSNCYYLAMKEQSVAGSPKSNCTRKDKITLSSLPSIFEENWIDGSNGPILSMHQN